MEQYTESQYDDDLTVGVDEYDDFVQTDDVDLFEFYGEEESSISKLKTIVLSIDWEITDENLQDFNDELLVLKEEQSNEKINLVYIQALEKIGKYIYKEKSNSNHNAIKLLQSFFYTLEKNITSDLVSDDEKKQLLIEDVQKFEKLKGQISGVKPASPKTEPVVETVPPVSTEQVELSEPIAVDDKSPILKLKAIILAMDWEITDKELNELGLEVKALEEKFKDSRPKVIFLQGIGVLGAYIKKKRSNAHADVFKLLHSFCENLEKIVDTPHTYEEEKAILLPEVDKFNAFKEVIASTIDQSDENEEPAAGYDDQYSDVAPAFADVDDDVQGFQEDEEAATLSGEEVAVGAKIDSFFGEDEEEETSTASGSVKEETLSTVNSFFDREEEVVESSEQEVALQGVNVETDADDDSDEEPLPFSDDGQLAPALASDAEVGGFNADTAGDGWEDSDEANEVFDKLDGFFDEAEEATVKDDNMQEALKGVDVETEADDDSDEDPLPFADSGELAPALAAEDDGEEIALNDSDVDDEIQEGVAASLDNLFGDDDVAPALEGEKEAEAESATEEAVEESFDNLFGSEEDEDTETIEELAPALSEDDDVVPVLFEEEESIEGDVDELESALFSEDDSPVIEEDEVVPALFDEEEPDGLEPALYAEDESSVVEEEDIVPALFGEEESDELEPVLASEEDASAVLEEDIAPALFDEEEQEEDLDELEPALLAEEESAAFEEDEIAPALFDEEDPKVEEDQFNSELFDQTEQDDTKADTALEEPDPAPALSVEDDVDMLAGVAEKLDSFEFDQDAPDVASFSEEEEVLFELVDDDEQVAEVTTFTMDESGEESGVSAEFDDEFKAVFSEAIEEDEAEDAAPEVSLDELGVEEPEQLFEDSIDEKAEDTVEDVLFVEETEDEPEQLFEEVDEQDDALQPEADQEVESEEDLEEYFKSTGLGSDQVQDALGDLRIGVSSIGVELDDTIIASLQSEIREVNQQWDDNPVGKTLLQLMSTVISHIDSYRYEASSDAHGMLLSVFDKVEMLDRGDIDQVEAQELLLTETSKVLQWQQQMLDRQAVKKGDTLTFMDPVRSEQSDPIGEFVFTENDIIDDDNAAGEDDMASDAGLVADNEEPVISVDGNGEITSIIREEMQSLKASLQQEIDNLRKELGKE